jgi:transcriptional regulator with XRE-family HTH domain
MTNKGKTNKTDKIIGNRIKFYRRKNGLTLQMLSGLIKISPQQLQKYESGQNRVSASYLKEIAEILNTPIEFFLIDPLESGNIIVANPLDGQAESKKLLYYFSLIKSEKIRKMLINNSAIFVEGGF